MFGFYTVKQSVPCSLSECAFHFIKMSANKGVKSVTLCLLWICVELTSTCTYIQINDFRSFQRNHAQTLDRQWNPINAITNGTKKLAAFTSDFINEGFLQENVWPFSRAAKKSGRNNEVTVFNNEVAVRRVPRYSVPGAYISNHRSKFSPFKMHRQSIFTRQ